MARSIVLRFDATCFDCGRSLSAGTTARWFGRGRVSCCGGQTNGQPPAIPPSALPPSSAPVAGRWTIQPKPPVPLSSMTPTASPSRPANRVAELALATGIPIDNLSAGMTPAHVSTLATKAPNVKLLVRLTSGARFIVPALHAHHVLACIAESCRDTTRDVALLAEDATLS